MSGNCGESWRSCALAVAAGVAVATTVVAPASAQDGQARVEFEIPAQPLASALAAFERATGLEVDAPAALVAGARAPAVRGELAPEQALQLLLRGTGLTYEPQEAGTLALVERSDGDAVRLDPINVASQLATEPTQRRQVLEAYRANKAETVVEPDTVRSFNSANNYDALRVAPGVSFLNGAGGRFGQASRVRSAPTWNIADVIEDYPSINTAGIGAEDGGLESGPSALIPSIALEAIEVQKGGLGVQYGTDADGGVIVNRLKQGRPGGPRGTVWAEASAIDEQLLMADVSGGSDDGRWDYYAAGKALNGDYDEVTDQEGDRIETDQFYSGLAKLGYNPDPDSRLELLALAGEDEVEYTTLGGEERRTTNDSLFLGLNWEQRLSEAWGYDLGYTHYRDRAVRFSLTQDGSLRDRPQRANTVFANGYYDTALSEDIDYSLAFGAEHERYEQREEAELGTAKDFEFSDTSVYALNSLTLLDRIVLSGGLRAIQAEDDFRDQDLLAYDLGAAYTFQDTGTILRVSRSTGYSRNKGFVFFFGPIEEAGGVRLTESETSEIGLQQPFLGADGARVGQLELSLFRTDYEHVPTFSGWGAGEVYYNELRAEGVELSGDWLLAEGLSLFGSATYLDNEITDTTNPSGAGVESTQVPVPRTTAALGLEWQANPRLRLQSIVSYDEGMRSEDVDLATGSVTVTENTGYTRWNAAAFYDLAPRWTVFLRAENLLDEEDLGYTATTTGPGGTTETELLAEDPGRFFALGVSYRY